MVFFENPGRSCLHAFENRKTMVRSHPVRVIQKNKPRDHRPMGKEMKEENLCKSSLFRGILVILAFLAFGSSAFADGGLKPSDVMATKTCSSAVVSPDGRFAAYTVSVPRGVADEPGGAWSELYLASLPGGEIRPYVTGRVNVRSPQWRPGGKELGFITARGAGAFPQVWAISVDGGEARALTSSPTPVIDYRWHPKANRLAYIAQSPPDEKDQALRRRGFDFIYYEENLRHRNLYMLDLDRPAGPENPVVLTKDITVWSFEISPDGRTIALSCSEKNLVDHQYMFQEVKLLDLQSGDVRSLIKHSGKMGGFAFSPDGAHGTYTASLDLNDHAVSQLYLISLKDGATKNLTPPDFKGHISWADWRDNQTLVYLAAEGVWNNLYTVGTDGRRRTRILDGEKEGLVFSAPQFSSSGKDALLTGQAPRIPSEIFHWTPGKAPRALTDLNPWVRDRRLGRQEVIRYKARDGMEIEGLLIYPVDYQAGVRYPLIVTVHGGPEAHYSQGWQTGYLHPAQVLAARGYLVFLPNYRASTGYGVPFAREGFMDPAGKEFDDIADGIEHLTT
ncbi:MAG: S9 family peptidase, partial [Candidatus Aminicenantes bacterium]|nr:S9 family peptidase [Candidatus Aminicenantes bacterium]